NVNPYPVTGKTAALSVLGADEAGESSLMYTWSTTTKPTGAANPTFSINGTNGAKNTTVTSGRAGTYVFLVTISNGSSTTTSSVSVLVNQTLTGLTITPTTATLPLNGSEQINAGGTDQFGQAMSTLPALNWSVSAGGGSVDPSGLYTASGTPGTYTITASSGSV